jgi:hypothetical protein
LRINKYRKEIPVIPLPSEPIITRRGTWLKAAFFHVNDFENVLNVIKSL